MSSTTHLTMDLTGVRSGKIKGESAAAGFEEQIELDQWNWTLDRTDDGNVPSGKSMQGGTEPSVFTFSKRMDRSTTTLLKAMSANEELAAVLHLHGDDEAGMELKVALEKVRVIDYRLLATGDDGGGGLATEEWVFNYASISFEYKSARAGKGGMRVALTRPPGART